MEQWCITAPPDGTEHRDVEGDANEGSFSSHVFIPTIDPDTRGHPPQPLDSARFAPYEEEIAQREAHIDLLLSGHGDGAGGSGLDVHATSEERRSASIIRIRFCPDLIVRHANAEKLAFARASGKPVDHRGQLNTIHVQRLPKRGSATDAYANPPYKGKTVLLADGILTEGLSLESGRRFVEAAKADVIVLAWLKTISKPYLHLAAPLGVDPFQPAHFKDPLKTIARQYDEHVNKDLNPASVNERLTRYSKWDWPK